jgi:hypothetical protein
MENKIKHFETLWEEGEKLALKQYKDVPNLKLIQDMIELLKSMEDMEMSDASQEAKISWNNRRIGEFLFMISAVSARQYINVYSSLKEEILLNEIDEQSAIPLPIV